MPIYNSQGGVAIISVGQDAPIQFSPANGFTVPVGGIGSWTLLFRLYSQAGGAPLIAKTIGAGIVITNPVNGLFTVTLAAADTLGFTYGTYLYNIWRTDSGNDYPIVPSTLGNYDTVQIGR